MKYCSHLFHEVYDFLKAVISSGHCGCLCVSVDDMMHCQLSVCASGTRAAAAATAAVLGKVGRQQRMAEADRQADGNKLRGCNRTNIRAVTRGVGARLTTSRYKCVRRGRTATLAPRP